MALCILFFTLFMDKGVALWRFGIARRDFVPT